MSWERSANLVDALRAALPRIDRREASVQEQFPRYRAIRLTPTLRRITAPNGGKLTGPGTNTYLVGDDAVCVIDPGVRDSKHLDAIVRAGAGRIRWVAATHTHPDHSTGAMELARRTGAQTLGYGEHLRGSRRDTTFVPDRVLRDGDVVDCGSFKLRALHTPGHTFEHLCYLIEGTGLLIAGDQVMDGSTVVIAPPDGHMGDYVASLQRLQREPVEVLAPAHGHLLPNAYDELQGIIDHRLAREAKIVGALVEHGPLDSAGIVAKVYTDVPKVLHPLARRSVEAHMEKLADEGRAVEQGGAWAMVDR